MTSLTRQSVPARHAGADAYPGPRQDPRAPRSQGVPQPGPQAHGPVRPPSVPDRKDFGQVSARPVLTVIVLGAAAVIGLWWYSAPAVRGLGGWLTGAGEILGLLAGYGVVVLVALMARLPPLERGIGTDQLARWHAMGGRYVVSVIVAHGLLIVWGYAVQAHTTVVSESATLQTQYLSLIHISEPTRPY